MNNTSFEPSLRSVIRWIGRYLDEDCPAHVREQSLGQSLNRTFIEALGAPENGSHTEITAAVAHHAAERLGHGQVARFFSKALLTISDELRDWTATSRLCEEQLEKVRRLVSVEGTPSRRELAELCQGFFFPEGVVVGNNKEIAVAELRKKRKVVLTEKNNYFLADPFREILITSNALLTTPLSPERLENIPGEMRDAVRAATWEEQQYWYDHPVPLGVSPENNEILYGLRGLDDALAFEKKRGSMEPDARVNCLLSISVTHKGLRDVARHCVEDDLLRTTPLKHLNVYCFTEDDTERLVKEVLIPAGERCPGRDDSEGLREVFGVDGEYGRHYSFLKAVAALFALTIDPSVRATFKIDLDQVFPQEELVRETGRSAFEHLASPLWGAEGLDRWGRPVELGMIAGALVNERDIGRSLFTPDVAVPEDEPRFDELVFRSGLPQALSTEAEMMARYDDSSLDGKSGCIQRVHVTGGTNGILLESLRRHRPFTPTFIARAEDQAYLMSVLFEGDRHLRYLHQAGFFMRHDKESFAGDAIRTASLGKLVGDYVRIVLFSRYARLLPWSVDEIKEMLDPFTGCFISRLPVTVASLRLSLRAARFYREGEVEKGDELLRLGSGRLMPLLEKGAHEALEQRYERERRVWNRYYDVLDALERFLRDGDETALSLKERAERIFESCLLRNK